MRADECFESDVPPQHVTLLGFFQNQHELVNAIYFIFNVLDERSERVRNVINESI